MLVKKVKTVHMTSESGEPTEERLEERYVLTADIDLMAGLIGLPPDVLRHVLSYELECGGATYYGEARNADYFRTAANQALKPRKLELSKMHLRVTERVKTDASGSFLVVPVTVTSPDFVGNLSQGYQLIPHIVAAVNEWGKESLGLEATSVSIFQPTSDNPANRMVAAYPDNVSLKLVGFDLLLIDDIEYPTTELTPMLTPANSYDQVIYDYGFGIKIIYTIKPSAEIVEVVVTHDGFHGKTQLCLPVNPWEAHGSSSPHEILTMEQRRCLVTDSEERLLDQPGWEEGRRVLGMVCNLAYEGYPGIGWHNA